jgi:hypothetical protein
MGDERMSDEGAFRDLADNYAFLKIESDKKISSLKRLVSFVYKENETLKERMKELESALCETCKDPRCEDSVVELLKQKVARLEMALADIAEGDCTCFEDDSCAACRAKKELRGGE